jgi:ATP-dependent Zn protease
MNKNKKNTSLIPNKLNFSELLKFQRLFLNSIKLEMQLIYETRESFNPNKFFIGIKHAYNKKQFFKLITQLSFYLGYSLIYYLFFIWILVFPIKLFTNLQIWKITFIKLKVSVEQYRNYSRNSINLMWKQNTNFRIGITFVPVVLGISQMIILRYQDQTFSVFIQKNLPSISLSPQKLSWETYEHITSKKFDLKNFFLTNFYVEKIKTDLSSKMSGKQAEKRFLNFSSVNRELLSNQFSNSLDFLKRIDFYSDSILIEFTSKWQKKENQIYFGIFPNDLNFNSKNFISQKVGQEDKKQFFLKSDAGIFNENKQQIFSDQLFDTAETDNELSCSENETLNSSKNLSARVIGNNWYTISARDLNLFFNNSFLRGTIFDGRELSSSHPINWIKQNSVFKIFFKLLIPENYFSFFYNNLDELPVKLNESYYQKIENLDIKKLSLKKKISPWSTISIENGPGHSKGMNTLVESKFYKSSKNFNRLPRKKFFSLKDISLLSKNKNILHQKLLFAFRNKPNYSKFGSLPSAKVMGREQNSVLFKLSHDNYQNREKFYKKYNLLQNEFKMFFYEKGLNPSNFLVFLDSFSNTNLNNYNENELQEFNLLFDYCSEQILKKLDLLELDTKMVFPQSVYHEENFVVQPRIMSGYKFPDMRTSDIQSLILQFFYRNIFSNIIYFFKNPFSQETKKVFSPLIKIELPSSFIFHSKYNFKNFTQPKLNIKYRPTYLEGIPETAYLGPGVVRNRINKDVEITNKEYVQNWLKKYLSSDNPLTDRRDEFFGFRMTLETLDENTLETLDENTLETLDENTLETLDKNTISQQNVSKKDKSSFHYNFSDKLDSEKVRIQKDLNSFDKNYFLKQLEMNNMVVSNEEKLVEKVISQINNDPDLKESFISYEVPVIACDEQFEVLYLTEEEWSVILEKIIKEFEATALSKKKNSQESQENETPVISLPLIRIKNPTNEPIEWPLTQIDYQSAGNFFIAHDSSELKFGKIFNSSNNGDGTIRDGNSGDGTSGDGTSGDGTIGNGTSGDGTSGNGTSGDGTSGNGTSGDGTIGNGTSGDGTSGDGTSGDGTSGDGTIGNGTIGDGTIGDGNSGDGTIGDGNSGDGTIGDGTSGNGTSGDGTSGDGTSGDGNSGDGNSGDGRAKTLSPSEMVESSEFQIPLGTIFDGLELSSSHKNLYNSNFDIVSEKSGLNNFDSQILSSTRPDLQEIIKNSSLINRNQLGEKAKNFTTIKYHYLPFSQTLVNSNLPHKTIFGGIHQRNFSIYNSKNFFDSTQILDQLFLTRKFRESWEPITTQSWLTVTQITFGFFVLYILQNFYKNYGRELLSYILDLAKFFGITDDSTSITIKEKLDLGDTDKGFRLIKKVKKRFKDIAGIDNILPELSEIVWFLRNSGRSFQIGNILPQGILLVGPPGTGKTLLVQAIAGEAEVPVLVQSGSSLNDPQHEGLGAQRLENIFEEARQIAPCIVFIDEIDSLGERRDNVIQNPMGADELIESLNLETNQDDSFNFIPKPTLETLLEDENEHTKQKLRDQNQTSNNFLSVNENSFSFSEVQAIQKTLDKQKTKREQLRLLMQFLVELDGLHSRKGVIVIGATNRPNVLDPALTRPGRFDKIITLEIPNKQKRIEILKLYSENLGINFSFDSIFESKQLDSSQKNIFLNESDRISNLSFEKKKNTNVVNTYWEYLSNRTIGFSAADLAAAMNESCIRAILNNTIHTLESIEQGIDSVTSSSSEKVKLENKKNTDPFFISRLAYYQAGKAVVHTLVSEHPPAIVLHLWPKPKNLRHAYISNALQKDFLKKRRVELESRLIGLYAGKAAELLLLSNDSSELITPKINSLQGDSQKENFMCFKKSKAWHSNLGIEELTFASSLANFMITKCYFYSKNLATHKLNKLFTNHNWKEFKEDEILEVFKQIAFESEAEISGDPTFSSNPKYFQKWMIRPWWQAQIVKQTELIPPAYDDWYRIYLPDPEESERNIEWLPPDEYYHNNSNLLNLVSKKQQTSDSTNLPNSSINSNDLYEINRDYIYHSLVLSSFNKAFSILDENRELLDFFATYLTRYEIIRQHKINEIILQFQNFPNFQSFSEEPSLKSKTEAKNNSVQESNKEKPVPAIMVEVKNTKKILQKSWGKNSRRVLSRFIDFDILTY